MEFDPRRLFDLSIDLLCVADLRGYFLYLNPAWERVLGYTLDELREHPFLDFVHPDDREATLAEMEKIGRGVKVLSFDNRYRARDGTYRWFNWTSAPAPEEGLTYAIARDITERRRWEEAESERRELKAELSERRRNERHLRAQHLATREMTETGSVEDVAARVLRPLCENLDWALGELWARESGAKAMRHRAAWHGDDPRLAAFAEASRSHEFVQGAGLPGRVWGLGAPTWISDAASEPGYNRAELAFAADLHTVVAVPVVVADQVVAAMCFFSRKVGEPDREVVEILASVGLQFGQFMARRQVEAQFLQSQKMEAVGRLAGGVAHDFNNLLTVIGGYSEMTLAALPEDSRLRRNIEDIQRAGERAAALTRQLLAFSRKQTIAPRVIALNDLAEGMHGLLQRLIGEDIRLRLSLDPALGTVRVDPAQMEQVVMNLAVNARDAMPTGGTLTIETANIDLDETYVEHHVGAKAGPHVMLAVSDTGHGMDKATLARLFEPFFTTKEPGRGTGLGLATVYGVVKQSGGNVWVYSEVGRGSTFKVYLPRTDAPAEAEAPQEPVAETRGSETILLVEDEPMVRRLAKEILVTKGYSVLDAGDGKAAITVAARHNGAIDLLVTDVVMPNVGGRELADEIVRLHPDVKVLYLSGYTSDSIVHHGVLDLGVAYLQKPFTPNALLRKVREVLLA